MLTVTAGAVTAPAVSTATASAADTTAATSKGRQAASGPNPVLRTDLVTRVTPRNNWLVTAVAIPYSYRIDLRGGVIPSTAFQVKATVGKGKQTAARTVTRVYPNTVAEVDDRSDPGRPGDRLIVELDPNDSNARAAGTDPLPPFRLYRPEGFVRNPQTRTRYPLVVTLYGGGEVADNNMTQLTSNRIAVTFAKPERQRRDPAFVLSPQIPLPRPMDGPDGTAWTDAKVQAALIELIDTFVSEHSRNVDTGSTSSACPQVGVASTACRRSDPRCSRLPCPLPTGATRPPWRGSHTFRCGPTTPSTARSSPTGRAGSATPVPGH
ncbi:hypothetical protein [Streptomyces sp. NPDC021212]|uniref:hypothetical protein n=1 Tax=Streptomyces sp. NPDC021212 TaxID=3365118 RepID=UPI00379FA279